MAFDGKAVIVISVPWFVKNTAKNIMRRIKNKAGGDVAVHFVGACISDLSEEKRINLLCRLILRNKLIRRLIRKAEDGNSNYWNRTLR